VDIDFGQLFQAVPDPLIVVDGDGRIVMANHLAERLFGYPESGLVGLELEALMPESARASHRRHRAAYMASPRVRPMGVTPGLSLVGQRRDGQRFPVDVALSPLAGENGTFYLASVRDVSGSVMARQLAVRARYDALEARIGRLALECLDERRVIEELPAMLADTQGVEAVAIGLLKPERGELQLLGSIGFGDGTQHFETSDSPLWSALADGLPFIVEDVARQLPTELAWPVAGGAGGSLAMMPLLGRDGVLGALIARSSLPRHFDHDAVHLLRSIANLLAALLQRRSTEEQLAHSQRLDAIGQLTGGIAHDFNNLLTIVSGSLQLLEAELGERDPAAELLASAQRSVRRGAELTTKLLAFARRQRLTPSAVDVGALLRDLQLMLKATLGEAIELEIDCPASLPPAHVDSTQLDAALVNLALNARDAMPRGGRIAIQVRERRVFADEASADLPAGHYVRLSVSDTGRGMTPETLARAMEPFFTTKGSGHGTGLGLSMVYGFAKQSGGHLRLESRLGYGTQVELFLPVRAGHDGMVAATVPATRAARGGSGEIVLVVEDEPEVRNLAALFLGSVGYRVRCAGNAQEALRLLKAEPGISALFSDVMLGSGANGDELARAALKLRPDLAVLLTSGYEEVVADRPPSRTFELLPKPYLHEQLCARLRRLLDARKS
jgi:PAS domain S-box-containing protein